MKYFTFCCLFFFLILGKSIKAQNNFDAKAKTKEIIWLFKHENFKAVYNQMDAEMKRRIDIEQLQAAWDGLIMRFDSIYAIDEPVLTDLDSFLVTVTAIHFKNVKLGLKFSFNNAHQISGFFVVPLSFHYQPADYVDATTFYEIKKNVPDNAFPSEGVLTIPTGKKNIPLIIVIGGSGPTDKDLTIGPNKIYKDFAWALAARGIAVYRFDKRTLKFGAKMGKNLTVNDEYLIDLKLIVKMLAENELLDKNNIFLMGHSEGGYLMPYFAKNLSGIKGFISLAGNYRDLAEIIPEQLEYLASKAKTTKEKEEILKSLPAAIYARDHFTKSSPDDSLPLGMSTSYLWYLNQNSPKILGSNLINKPCLFLQGGRDYQVIPKELYLWKNALQTSNTFSYKIYPDLNHIFLSGKGASIPSEYEIQSNVPKVVIDDIVNWILLQ